MNLLNYKEQKRTEKSANRAHVNNQLLVINHENFFTEGNEHGFISKAEFMTHIDSIVDSEYAIKSLETFFSQLSNETSRMKISRFPWTNPKTNEKVYFIDTDSRISRQYSLRCFNGLEKLIDGYTYGKFKCQLDLDELFKKAQKQN